MEHYTNWDITELPLSSSYFRDRVSRFLEAAGLRMDALDTYYCVQTPEGKILAGAGISKDIIKCVAVAQEARSEGLLTPLVSRIIRDAGSRGIHNLKVFTKPEYRPLFESLGFKALASAPHAILLENGRGLADYCAYLEGLRRPGSSGVIVMNANPFTKGHQYLIEKALEQVDNLFIIPVREDVSMFPYSERMAMIRACGKGLVVEGSAYSISAATFPTYFLKSLDMAAEEQMRLDLDLFAKHIAPALGASVRFVGTEPADALTARYNALMKGILPIDVVEVERLENVSASCVRMALEAGDGKTALALTPEETHPYIYAFLAESALKKELETPCKPGLVCPESQGSHKDMDYALMQKGIAAIRPYFPLLAKAASADEVKTLGLAAEKAMLEATGGVNTHRGAIYALGLALNSACTGKPVEELAAAIPAGKEHKVKSAREMALEGYQELYADWLPYYEKEQSAQKTLLRIMSTLDDTCIIHRVGEKRAQQVKEEAARLLEHFDEEKLKALCARFQEENISPGGAADMLSLTLFIHTII